MQKNGWMTFSTTTTTSSSSSSSSSSSKPTYASLNSARRRQPLANRTNRGAPHPHPSKQQKRARGHKLFKFSTTNTPSPAAATVQASPDIRISVEDLVATRIHGYVRVRPPLPFETSSPEYETVASTSDGFASLAFPGYERDFKFDATFGPATTQAELYGQVVHPVVAKVVAGYNGAILAYGQTGTGKTYTLGMLNSSGAAVEEAGVVPRALAQIFDSVTPGAHEVTLSFVQVYCDKVYDLLDPDNDGLQVRESRDRGFFVPGLTTQIVQSLPEAMQVVSQGLSSRVMAATLMNATSSRSHVMLAIDIVREDEASLTSSRLLLVDLAGSERVKKTTSEGIRLREAKFINGSLSALGNVIAAKASSSSAHIPWRDSILTKLLHSCLDGTSITALIATIGPAAYNRDESLSTLQYAQRAMHISTHAQINTVTLDDESPARIPPRPAAQVVDEGPSPAMLMAVEAAAEAEARAAQLESKLAEYQTALFDLVAENKTLTSRVSSLETRVPPPTPASPPPPSPPPPPVERDERQEPLPQFFNALFHQIYTKTAQPIHALTALKHSLKSTSRMDHSGIPDDSSHFETELASMDAFPSEAAFVDYMKQMAASVESNVDFAVEHLEARSRLCAQLEGELEAARAELGKRDSDRETFAEVLRFLLSSNRALRKRVGEDGGVGEGVYERLDEYLVQISQ